jgi:hypothetical protein
MMAEEVTNEIWVNSWFTIWYEPRATMRRIVDTDPRKFVRAIYFVVGAIGAIYSQVAPVSADLSANLPHVPRLGPIGVVIAVLFSGLVSIITFYGLAALYRWSGAILGGTATRIEMRSAVAWSQVPGIYLQVVNIVTAILGFDVATTPSSVSPYGVVESIIGIWVLVISLKCVGEVHHFSAWRALGAFLLGTLLMLAVLAGGIIAIWVAVRAVM